ncbi:MAG: hypothetical protein HRU75_09365 [Planctomycetia bacterium]|nr:MAG: hypothetical protein HRU75_09365 [Planctomycetia bacterium]
MLIPDTVTRLDWAEAAAIRDLAEHSNKELWGRRSLTSVIEQTLSLIHDVNNSGLYSGAFAAQHRALEIQLGAVLRNLAVHQ